jgi:hypothetical protein
MLLGGAGAQNGEYRADREDPDITFSNGTPVPGSKPGHRSRPSRHPQAVVPVLRWRGYDGTGSFSLASLCGVVDDLLHFAAVDAELAGDRSLAVACAMARAYCLL